MVNVQISLSFLCPTWHLGFDAFKNLPLLYCVPSIKVQFHLTTKVLCLETHKRNSCISEKIEIPYGVPQRSTLLVS